MKIFKVFFWLRIILLSWLCFTLISGELYIEAGIIALFILTDLIRSKLYYIEIRLQKLENKNRSCFNCLYDNPNDPNKCNSCNSNYKNWREKKQ